MLVNKSTDRVWQATETSGVGDHLFTQRGEEHNVVAVTDAVIFVSSQKSTTVVE